jgi:hypothetical protein
LITLEPMENLRLVAKYRYRKELDDLNMKDWESLCYYVGESLLHRWGVLRYVHHSMAMVPPMRLANATYSFGSGPPSDTNTITFNFKVTSTGV